MHSATPAATHRTQKLFVQHIHELRGFAIALVGNAHAADDIVQETFLTVMEKADSYDESRPFRAWIFGIARFKALSAYKTQTRHRQLLDENLVDRIAGLPPEPEAEHEERIRQIDDCIKRLAPATKRAIEMRYKEDCAPPLIAKTLNWTLGAINVALTRGRKLLRDCVRKHLLSQPT
jgi:RNA polymerase sigma-70 factor, ECF subfamily